MLIRTDSEIVVVRPKGKTQYLYSFGGRQISVDRDEKWRELA